MTSLPVLFIRYAVIARVLAALSGVALVVLALTIGFAEEVSVPLWTLNVAAIVFIVSLVAYVQGEYPMSQTQKDALHDVERSPHLKRIRWVSIGWLVVSAVLVTVAAMGSIAGLYWIIVGGSAVWLALVIHAYAHVPSVWNGLTIMPTNMGNRMKRGMIIGAAAILLVLLVLFGYYSYLLQRHA